MLFLVAYAIAVVVAFICMYIYLTRNFSYWKKLNVPFIKPVPLFGNFYKVFILQHSIGEAFWKIHASITTKYIGLFVFDQPYLLVCDPELIKYILIKDFGHFTDRSIIQSKHDKFGSNIMFIVKNPAWRSIRTKMLPIFTSSKIKNMLPLILEASKELKCYLKDVAVNNKYTEAREMCMKYTTDVIASCAFGVDAHSFRYEDAPFHVAAQRIFDWNYLRSISMAAYFIAPGFAKAFRFKFVDAIASKFLNKVFWETVNEREKSGIYRNDLVDLLIEIRKNNDSEFIDDTVIAAQAIQFFFAGFETAGTTLTFALYSLARNSDIQHKLRNEITQVFVEHGNLTYEVLNSMQYLDSVIKETLRMYPIGTYLSRECTKSYQIPGTELVLEKGLPVYISILGLHYDPQNFANPYKFDPDRFSAENKTKIRDATYMPFGEGPRNCIGSRFALLTLKVALVQIMSEFEVETCPTTLDPLIFEPKGFLLSPYAGRLNLHFKKYAGTRS